MAVSEKGLTLLDQEQPHDFITPVKKIHDGSDLSHFSSSQAYRDIMTFILQLNQAVFPFVKDGVTHLWTLESHDSPSEPISKVGSLIKCLDGLIDEAPPDPGPRRFGNVAFRDWNRLAEKRVPALLHEHLPPHIFEWKASDQGETSAESELLSYLLGSFGSAQRLDYGTGHELSFLAFIGCLWKLGVFPPSQNGDQERGIVLDIFEPYLRLVRRLILTYNLEPAGSHGVWGLDDHSFLPYIFGSAQLCPPVPDDQPIPNEGSVTNAPAPSSVNDKLAVERERKSNMYFAAIGFIYDVKKGPFWEHSPILYDISGVPKGWAKINKGMIKMYNVEVLSKFPVVQHFQFGSLFSFTIDPLAKPATSSVHVSSQPKGDPAATLSQSARPVGQVPVAATSAPWAKSGGTSTSTPRTVAPWKSTADGAQPAPTPNGSSISSTRTVPTRAPWAAPSASMPQTKPS